MSEYVYAGLTSQTLDVFLGDSSSTTGEGLTGLVYNTAGLTCYYRKGATGTSSVVSLATQTVDGVWSSGGFVEVDATNMPGIYRFDIPDVVVDTEGFVTIYFQGATDLVPTASRVDCNPLPVNVKQISDDTVAADNLELQYDTTGLTGDTFPATQLQSISSSDVATAVKTLIVEAEGSVTMQQALSVILSVLAGESTNNGLTFKSPDGVATRVAATVDANQNRTGITLTPSS